MAGMSSSKRQHATIDLLLGHQAVCTDGAWSEAVDGGATGETLVRVRARALQSRLSSPRNPPQVRCDKDCSRSVLSRRPGWPTCLPSVLQACAAPADVEQAVQTLH